MTILVRAIFAQAGFSQRTPQLKGHIRETPVNKILS